LRTVQRGDLAARLRDALAELGRLDDLELRAEAQELAIGVAQVLKRDDGAAVGVDPRLARQPAPQLLRDAYAHFDARQGLLEVARPLLPERRELELRRPRERLLERPHRRDPRDAVDAHAGRAA